MIVFISKRIKLKHVNKFIAQTFYKMQSVQWDFEAREKFLKHLEILKFSCMCIFDYLIALDKEYNEYKCITDKR